MKVSNGREAFTLAKQWFILYNSTHFKHKESFKKGIFAHDRLSKRWWSHDLNRKRQTELRDKTHDYI